MHDDNNKKKEHKCLCLHDYVSGTKVTHGNLNDEEDDKIKTKVLDNICWFDGLLNEMHCTKKQLEKNRSTICYEGFLYITVLGYFYCFPMLVTLLADNFAPF